jgi:hypothetical protein
MSLPAQIVASGNYNCALLAPGEAMALCSMLSGGYQRVRRTAVLK